MIYLAARNIFGMSILHVAQKNSIAKQVANILSRSNRRTIPTLSKFNPVFQFDLQSKAHRFTSVRGHIFDYELPEQCKSWKNYDNKKILLQEVPMIKKLGPDMDDVVRNLSKLARQHKQLILWLDCDRQGQAIAFEVIDVCTKINPKLIIKRARFSAVTPTDIWNAYNGLVNPNKLQADAVNYRIEIDFRSGCTFTRFQTVVFQSIFHNQSGSFLSYGPCQMPTLNFVVQRYLQIKNFKPEKYWFIEMVCVINDKTGIPFTWEKKNTRNQVQANQAMYNMLSQFPDGNVMGKVKDRKVNPKKKYRPYPLTTVKFQKVATDKLRMSSAKAMQIAQKLYQRGYISYPRTQTNAFPKTMNLKSLIQRLQNSQQFGGYVNKLLNEEKYVAPKSGTSNDQAHTPIHPVKFGTRKQFDADQWRVYELVVRSFLACCSGDAVGEEYQVKAQVAGEKFKASYLTIKQYNYLQIYPYQKWVQTSFPAQIPQQFPSILTLKDSKTTPPGHLTESQLIDLMQKNQIGTDSTIHQHIQTIQKRLYAVKTNNTFKPTNLGASLIQTYIQLGIKLPECQIRRKIEEKMNRIASGELEKRSATRETLAEMVPVYERLMEIKEQWLSNMKKYMESNADLKQVSVLQRSPNSQQNQQKKTQILACKCQKCNQGTGLVRYSQKNQSYFIGCSKYPNCRWTYSLPNYIKQIKQTNKQCTKCTTGKIVQISAKEGKVIESFMMKMRLQESQDGFVEVCLTPNCDGEFYSDVAEFGGFSRQNTSQTTNQQTTRTYQSNYNNAQSSQHSNLTNTTKYARSNTNQNKFDSKHDPKQYKKGSWAQNTNTYNSNTNREGKKQIVCYRCNQPGHIAPNCPNAGKGGYSNNSVNKRVNQFKSGFPNAKKNQIKRAAYQQDDESGNVRKVCPQCGAEGRHPRGSDCPTIKRKKPKQ